MNAGIVMQFSYYIFCLSPHVSKYLSIIYDVQDYMSFMKANSIKKLSYPIMHWKIADVADCRSAYNANKLGTFWVCYIICNLSIVSLFWPRPVIFLLCHLENVSKSLQSQCTGGRKDWKVANGAQFFKQD